MMRMIVVLLMLSLQATSTGTKQPPRPEDFPVKEVFQGAHAAPDLSNPEARRFRTRLREAVAYGPNFAGHYTLALWGCGAGCVFVAVIDAQSGRVWFAPFSFQHASANDERAVCHHGSDFELTSELFVVQGDIGGRVGTHYFRWRNERFSLIHFDPKCD